jgi:hypothetical protein
VRGMSRDERRSFHRRQESNDEESVLFWIE